MMRTKLTDKIYGQMLWEEWDDDEAYWFAPLNIDGKKVEFLIEADSPLDFFAVGRTHSVYQRIVQMQDVIRAEMVRLILEKSRELFKKKRQRNAARDVISKNLKLSSIKIYQELSAEIRFVGNVAEDPEEIFHALIDAEGKLVDAGILEL